MAVFMLNTDSVTVAAETLNTLATDVNSIISSVNGYSTSNDDGFAFDIAKSSMPLKVLYLLILIYKIV